VPDYIFYYSGSSRCNIINVSIGNSVISIGRSAFSECNTLKNISIGKSLTTIDENAFKDCSGLVYVNITDLAKWCEIDFGDFYLNNPLRYASNFYLNSEPITNLIIPEGVTKIPGYAFSCNNITNVTIPDSVTHISSNAFYKCTELTNIIIGNGVTNIGYNAFYGCKKLTSVIFKDSETWQAGSSIIFEAAILENSSTAAQYLNSYSGYDWKKVNQ